MSFNLDVVNILVVLVALINTVYGLIVYSRNRNDKTNLSFFILTLAVSAWGVSMFAFRGFSDLTIVVFASRILYVSAAAIPLAFLYFIFIFPHENYTLTERQKYLIPLPFVFIAALSLVPNFLIETVRFVLGGENFIVFNPVYHWLYGAYIVSYFGAGYILLIKRLHSAEGLYRLQILYILIGTLISTTIGVATNLFLPLFGVFALNWFGQVGVVVMIGAISYAVLKHHLFNIRVIATEVFMATLWIFIFIRTFLFDSVQDKITNIGLLALLIVVGIFLIRSVQKIDKLSEDKSKFVSFASHEIRTPLTFIKGASANILEGDFGAVSDGLKDNLQKIFVRANDVLVLVEQYLNKSRLELGQLKYDAADFDVRMLISQIVRIYQSSATQEGVTLSFFAEENKNYTMHGDQGKMKEVFNNLIDNSIKFSPKGSVAVALSQTNGKIVTKVTDTGIGISPENMSLLFREFSRAGNSNQPQIAGTGLGLFLAKTFVEAHKGKIWAESAGAGKGTTFFVELPVS